MRIIEKNLIGKHDQETCEDGIVVTDNFIAVIDGSTSKTAFRISEDMKNGRLAMTIISEFIKAMPADISLHDFCDNITKLFMSKYKACGLDIDRLYKHPQERMTASTIIYSHYYNQIWMIGDCQCLVNGQLYENPKPYEDVLAAKRAAIINAADDKKPFFTNDTARKAIIPEMLEHMQEQNKTYAVIDGFPIPLDKIKVIDITTPEIILASDGYPFLHPTLAESEKALSEQLKNDPLNVVTLKATKGLLPSNKSFDDRAYIRFITVIHA